MIWLYPKDLEPSNGRVKEPQEQCCLGPQNVASDLRVQWSLGYSEKKGGVEHRNILDIQVY